jgi:uncharacterized membrane protein
MSEQTRFPWRMLLLLSLALNLLAVGAVAGAYGAGVRVQREADGGAMVQRMRGPRAFLRALPIDTRAIMRQELADSWIESREARQAAIEARRAAFAAVAAEPYDAARVRTAFERLRAADQAALSVFHDNIAEAFGRITPEQRREALEALRRAAPSSRQNAATSVPVETSETALAPGERQTLEQRRQERRERRRARREEGLRQQQDQAN